MLAMFTPYQIEFWSGSEIDPIQREQCSDRSGVKLFTLYQTDMLHICFGLAKENWSQVQETDKGDSIPNMGQSVEQPIHIRSTTFQESYPTWNISLLESNHSKS